MRNTPARLARAIAVAALTTLVSVPAWSFTTTAEAADQPTSAAAPLVVATFNVRCANCSKHPMNGREKSWATRAPVVVSQILGENVDVIGVQEASPGLLSGTRTAQFEDLVSRLGAPYAVTDPSRYNCARTDTTFTRCGGFKNQGASQDAKIIYNTEHLALLGGGSLRLDGRKVGNGSARYMVWAKFSDLRTGKQFVFATAHFEPGTSKKKTKTRVKQVKKAVAELNRVAGGLPIIWGSDLASSKLTHSGNKSYDGFISRGFTDPIGNKYKTKVPKGAYADSMVNEQYFTLNNFAAAPKNYVSKGYKLGAHLDYILIKKNGHPVDVSEWKEVIRLDSAGRFDGVIPSDHNMVRATVELG